MTLSSLLALLLGSTLLATVLGKVFDRAAARHERVRDGYAQAVRAVVAWAEFPYRVRRRVDDEAQTLAQLVELGHELQERLACTRGWVSAEHPVMGELFAHQVGRLRGEVASATKEAWAAVPVTSPAGMNLAGEAEHVDVEPVVDALCSALRYRHGWRRLMWPALLRRSLIRRGLMVQGHRETSGTRTWPKRSGSAVEP